MTPEPGEYWTPLRAVLIAALVLGAVLVFDYLYEVYYLILAANAVAFVFILRLMWHYNKTSAWWRTAVGRTTMGLKAALLLLASSGLARRAVEQLRLIGQQAPSAEAVAEQLVTAAWACIAIAVVARYRVIVALQRRSRSQPEPPN